MASMWTKKAAKAGTGAKRFGLVKKQGSSSLASVFGGGDEESGGTGDERSAMNQRLRQMEASSQRRTAAAAADVDPSVYDYDGCYDAMKAEESAKMLARVGINAAGDGGQKRKASRYISSLQQACKVREREFDRVYERQLLKEQEEEKAKFGDTERYVTAAYKAQLQESRKWDMEDQRAAELEEKTTATSAGMHGFYANLLTKNIATGADVSKAAVSSYTHGSRRNAKMEPAPEPPGAAANKARAAFCAARGYADVADRLSKADAADEKRALDPAAKRPAPVPDQPEVDPAAAALSAKERFLARKRAKLAGGGA